ncbi:uncharacterized protein LOC134080409 [Sardina pilchardus]|uniref:uncharacterized protein LOC134080409 n=1 Tax=Sardina pilchardus TaxID=27697 RepID=UPI002E154BE8
MDSEATMVVAALGRPFGLGMLYDCRRDLLVPGLTMWDHNDLEKCIRKIPKHDSSFDIVATESIEDKSSALNLETSLRASFLSGLVQVQGSAKYLNDERTSKNQARVTLTYKTTTQFQELSMNHLGSDNIKHQNVLDKNIATHVVTGIQYGAQAFFIFDREVCEEENNQDIQGNMKVMINKIPRLSVEGEGTLKMEDKDKVNVAKFSCKFHGDFCLEKNPVSFQDAVEVYQSLPTLLGANRENAVPMMVWLLPLASLVSSAAKLVRQISIGLVQEAQNVLQDFSELDMRCNDAMRAPIAKQFPQISKKIRVFKEMCSQFKSEFQQTLAKKLPAIRGGGEEEAVLADILKKRHSSPFNTKDLNEWMDCKEKEIFMLTYFTNMMKNAKIISNINHLLKEGDSKEFALCFVFTSLESDKPYLSALSMFLRGTIEPDNTQNPHNRDVEKEDWHALKEFTDEMRKSVKLFSDFAEANKENENIKFLVVGSLNETQKGSAIHLYVHGCIVSENFEPPSKPETVTTSDINHNRVTLKISPPRFGAESITSYSVEYCVRGDDGWQKQTVPIAEEVTVSDLRPRVTVSDLRPRVTVSDLRPIAEEVTVSDLRPNTEYLIRCRAVTSAGVGPASEVSVKTLPCSPPGKPQVIEANSSDITVSWMKPADIGQGVQTLSYIVEYAKTGLQWNKQESNRERATISGLQAETNYTVRVSCDCGVAGRSKESITADFSTTRYERLANVIKRASRIIKSGHPSMYEVYEVPLDKENLEMHGCRGYTFGKESCRENRTIILLGANGSGKSTLIQGMINYIVGVEWKDDFRFRLTNEDQSASPAHTQISKVTMFKLNHQQGFKIPFSLTIVDIPSFGDTKGTYKGTKITEQLRNLFSAINEINAVCFVAKAALARLTPAHKYVFDSVLSIFKDVAENIRILVTFADGQRPPVLEAINTSGVPCPKTNKGVPIHFKFNNSALFAHNSSPADNPGDDEDNVSFDQMFWNMGTKSMKRFFDDLNVIHSKSLTTTRQVFREREQLDNSIENWQTQIRVGISKLEEIKMISETLQKYEAEINGNRYFLFDIKKPVQTYMSGSDYYITNCQVCSFTCHYPCSRANNDKSDCSAMGSNGYCTVCSGNCHWSVHFNQKYRWDYQDVMKKQTVKELQEKYLKATEEKEPVQALITKLTSEYDAEQDKVVEFIALSVKCLNRLREISLKPNPLSTLEYIDLLIEGEKAEAKPGWSERVKSLMAMKCKADRMTKLERRETCSKLTVIGNLK